MNLKNQVCSLKLAKKLKELGVKQESLWWWVDYTDTSILPINLEHRIRLVTKETMVELKTHNKKYPHCATIKKLKIYSTFTVAELGEMLPETIEKYDLTITKIGKNWRVNYGKEEEFDTPNADIDLFTYLHKCHTEANAEANARAKMMIYLLENKLMEV